MTKQTGILLSAIVFASLGLAVTARAHDSGAVTVLRGAAVERAGNASNGIAGVTVVRGQPAAKVAAKYASPMDKVPHRRTLRVTGGGTLWIVDGNGKRLTACQVRNTTQVGGRRIRCIDRALPRNTF
jgi:hypothetical protein